VVSGLHYFPDTIQFESYESTKHSLRKKVIKHAASLNHNSKKNINGKEIFHSKKVKVNTFLPKQHPNQSKIKRNLFQFFNLIFFLL
jgi:hypothetical protein